MVIMHKTCILFVAIIIQCTVNLTFQNKVTDVKLLTHSSHKNGNNWHYIFQKEVKNVKLLTHNDG